MTTKTLEELEEMREERNINASTLGECIGGRGTTWRQAVRMETASIRLKRNAVRVFKYYDIHGIVPEPGELALEPLGRGQKN